jgi:hypothetical protein|uniref:Uncharacterized protein n=1 Tax=Siphoviridae sp. ctpGU1 TaxID=2823601 RepID=A0A8S5LBY1_9CAUD|nr:MAG TPA: hypothetical protein [Siphoviridae sp. ctpGU1]DAK02120.1 MAG TPA: hypothetical protein [Caudoviricetes sp.]
MKWHKVYLRKMTEEEIVYHYGDSDKSQELNNVKEDYLIWEGETPEDLYKSVVVIYNIFDEFDKCVRQHTWADVNLRYCYENMKSSIIYWAELPEEEEKWQSIGNI